MIPLDTKQQKWLPLGLSLQDIATGPSCPDTTFPKLGKVYEPEHRFGHLQPPLPALLFDSELFCGKQVLCLNERAPEGAIKSSRKRFLVFDQSGDQTRLLHCGFPSSVSAEPNPVYRLSKDHAIPGKILLGDENCCNEEEESEMHENTEEIDALLYSDDDYESDDEVMSTGHSPFLVDQQACNETTEDELDDGPLCKRQKLLDHSSPSFVFATESNISSKQETGSGLSQDDEEQSRRRTDKIKTALRILESVVPGGVKGKEALLLIDEAIDYLKLLKQNLNSLTS